MPEQNKSHIPDAGWELKPFLLISEQNNTHVVNAISFMPEQNKSHVVDVGWRQKQFCTRILFLLDFQVEVWLRFWSWISVFKLMFGQDFELINLWYDLKAGTLKALNPWIRCAFGMFVEDEE